MSVLESVGGNQDLAIDTLLGMNDPDYVSQPEPAIPVAVGLFFFMRCTLGADLFLIQVPDRLGRTIGKTTYARGTDGTPGLLTSSTCCCSI